MTAFLPLVCAGLCSGALLQTTPPSPTGPLGAGLLQQLGSQVTMDLPLRDERGDAITLREAAGGKPFVLALVYYRCPMLCNLILGGLLETLVSLGPTAGEQFTVVTVSFDPAEGPDLAAAKKAHYVRGYGRPAGYSGWRFLCDASGSAARLCRETGFRVSLDPSTGQYAHASAILVLTPAGLISRYFMGVSYPARDVRLALVEASAGKIGAFADQILLFCFRFDPSAGKYTLAVWNLLRAGAAVTVLGLGVLLLRLSRRPPAKIPAAAPSGAGGT
jgi:protein SCO1/2